MSNLTVTAVISILVFAAAAYLVLAWPYVLAVLAVWIVWKSARYGWSLFQKALDEEPKRVPTSL